MLGGTPFFGTSHFVVLDFCCECIWVVQGKALSIQSKIRENDVEITGISDSWVDPS